MMMMMMNKNLNNNCPVAIIYGAIKIILKCLLTSFSLDSLPFSELSLVVGLALDVVD